MGYWVQSREEFSTLQVQVAPVVFAVIVGGALLGYRACALGR